MPPSKVQLLRLSRHSQDEELPVCSAGLYARTCSPNSAPFSVRAFHLLWAYLWFCHSLHVQDWNSLLSQVSPFLLVNLTFIFKVTSVTL